MRLTKYTHSCVRLEHEGQLNDRGLSSVNDWLTETTQAYRYLPAGQSCDKLPG